MSEKSTFEQELFRVVLLNEYTNVENAEQIRDQVAKRFKLSDKAAQYVFAGRPVVIKNNVDLETALNFKITLEQIGALCHIEQKPAVDDTDGYGYIERRISQQRKQKSRRAKTRPGQIMPDRRDAERRVSPD